MKTALIGYTGFLGGNLIKQNTFTDLYNSKNINEIAGKSYDLVISAGNSSVMWKANKEPELDWQNISSYMDIVKQVNAKHFVLCSTIEVYDNTWNVTEDSLVDSSKTKPYGQHRYKLEQFVTETFHQHTIIRLPNLFGAGLKKNFIYDLMYNNRWDLTHKDSIQQWYDLSNMWKDISIAVKQNIPLINFATEPIVNHELAKETLGVEFTNITEAPPRKYGMKSKYASLYGSSTDYLYQKKEVIASLKAFMEKEKHHGQ